MWHKVFRGSLSLQHTTITRQRVHTESWDTTVEVKSFLLPTQCQSHSPQELMSTEHGRRHIRTAEQCEGDFRSICIKTHLSAPNYIWLRRIFRNYLANDTIFRKKSVLSMEYVGIFPTLLSETLRISRKIQHDTTDVLRSSCEVPDIFVQLQQHWHFFDTF
jgi:hypothetical protein